MKRDVEERIAYPIEEGFEKIGSTRTGGYKAIAAGELATFKIGKRRMVTHQALLDYVDLKQRQSTGQAA